MKLLIVTSNYPRWDRDTTTPFVHNFARELVQQGEKVRVLAPHFVGAKTKEVIDGVEIRRFRYWLPQSGQTVCYQGGALGNLKKNPLNKLKLPMLVGCEFLALFWQTLSWKPDWINSHWLIPQGFVASIVSKLTNTKHVGTVHGGDVFALDSKTLRKFKRFVINTTDIITVNSSATQAKVMDIAPIASTPIKLIPTGILPIPAAESHFVSQLLQKLKTNDSQKLLLFVGRLSEEKGIGDAIKALRQLIDDGRNVRLIIVGEGHDRAVFESLTAELNLAENVVFIGWVQSADIYSYFAACDIFVGPSKQSSDGWVEAQGLTFLEAMLAGCAVIGSRSGGIPDAVIPGKTGWLVEPNSPDSLYKTLTEVLDSDNTALIEQAQAFVKNKYFMKDIVKAFRDMLDFDKALVK